MGLKSIWLDIFVFLFLIAETMKYVAHKSLTYKLLSKQNLSSSAPFLKVHQHLYTFYMMLK